MKTKTLNIKTFKIGEYAIGGIIEVLIREDLIVISAKDWKTKNFVKGQSFDPKSPDLLMKIDEYLNELTSSYYAEQILNYIKS